MAKSKKSTLTPSDIAELREHTFTPCESKEQLHDWILLYLGLDMPDTKIDPRSTSSPMDLIWEIYNTAKENKRTDFSQVLAYSSRDSFKTLAASVLEVLCIVHLGRSVSHMAAIKPQSKKSQQYIKRMLNRPLLRAYVTSKNDSTLELTRYKHWETEVTLTPAEFNALTLAEKDHYEEIKHYIIIIVCTMTGANSEHTPFMTVDEVDVVEDPEAYEEAKMIPNEYMGLMPITLLTSTRKYSFGLVQKELDDADESGLIVRNWNIIDVTQRCKPERHLPDEPEIPIYYSEDLLRAIDERHYKEIDSETQKRYKMEMGSPGCIKNCKLYAMCRGRLKKQEGTSPMLKSIPHIINVFRKVSIQRAKAQLMCWKPSTEGLIYPWFDPEIHMITAAQMANMLTGEIYPDSFDKTALIALCKDRGNKFSGGMDFGTTHCFATVTGFRDGQRFFIIGAREIPELEPTQQIDLCKPELEQLGTAWYGDTAATGVIRMFKKAGFTMYDWKKKPGSILEGIDTVRAMIMPSAGAEPRLYLLKGEEGCMLLSKRIRTYHWKLDTAGKPSDVPDEDEDDVLDALRYCLMNQFMSGGKVIASLNETIVSTGKSKLPEQHNYLQTLIHESLGYAPGTTILPTTERKGKKGKIHWNFG